MTPAVFHAACRSDGRTHPDAATEPAFWGSIRPLYAQALVGSDDELLAKTTAGLLHPATFVALKAAGLSVDEAAAVVADLLADQAKGSRR